MVTIKDIAKAAGVSHGTVSNVLNKRGNVRADKIKLVEEVARKLGYQINPQAQVLRKGFLDKCFVFLPLSLQERYHLFLEELPSILINYEVEVFFIRNSYEFSKLLKDKLLQSPSLLLSLGFSIKKDVEHLTGEAPKIIEIDTYSEYTNIGFNHKKIISLINQEMEKKKPRKCLFLGSPFQNKDGILAYLEQHYRSSFETVVLNVDIKTDLLEFYPLLKESHSTDFIFTEDAQIIQNLRYLYEWFGITELPNFYLIGSEEWVLQEDISYLHLNILGLSKAFQQYLKTSKQQVLDCWFWSTGWKAHPSLERGNIKILILKSPISQALKVLVERYCLLTQNKVELVELSYDELLERVKNPDGLQDIDIIRMDMAWLPDFSHCLLPLDKFALTKEINQKISNQVSREYSHVHKKQYSFPFDISSQLLIYRKDLFENSFLQREYFETFKKQLTVPKTYAEYDRVSKFFTRKYFPNSPTEFGHSLPASNPFLIASDFIPRFREHLIFNQLDIRKLPELLVTYQNVLSYSYQMKDGAWQNVIQNLQNGKTAMEIVFSNYISSIFHVKTSSDVMEFAYTTVPGGQALIGGGVLGISKHSNNVELSLDFISWLYSEEVSCLLAYLGGFLPTNATLYHSKVRSYFPWLTNFDETFLSGSRTNWFNFETNRTYEQLLGEDLLDRVIRK